MKRSHRTAHRILWLTLVPLLLVVVVVALGTHQPETYNISLPGGTAVGELP